MHAYMWSIETRNYTYASTYTLYFHRPSADRPYQ